MKHGRRPQLPRKKKCLNSSEFRRFGPITWSLTTSATGRRQSQTAINHEFAKPEKLEKLNCVTKLKILEKYLPITIDYVGFGGNNAGVDLLAAMNSTRNLILLAGKDV